MDFLIGERVTFEGIAVGADDFSTLEGVVTSRNEDGSYRIDVNGTMYVENHEGMQLAPLDTQPPSADAPRGDGIDAGSDSGYGKGYRAGVVDGYTGVNAAAVEILETELAAAREALRACINADLTGYWSPEEVAKRFFAAYPGSE